jgi:hypothetical protein
MLTKGKWPHDFTSSTLPNARDIQDVSEEGSILWEVILKVSEEVHKNVSPVLNGYGAMTV